MVHSTHPTPEAPGRLARTAQLAIEVQARHRVDIERQAAYREARTLTGSLLEFVAQLEVEQDPSELIYLQESARAAADGLVQVLGGTAAQLTRPRRTSLRLDQAVEVLDQVLTLAQQRLTGTRQLVLELALIIHAGVDSLASVELEVAS